MKQNVKSTKILLIGATGKTGIELFKNLNQITPDNIHVFLRNPNQANYFIEQGAKVFLGNLEDHEQLNTALYDVDKVFLVSSPALEQTILHKNVIEAAKKNHVQHLVRISAFGVRNPNYSLLLKANIAKMHAETEQYLEDSGVPFTHIRPNFFMQNFFGFKESILSQGEFFGAMNKGKIGTIHVKDIAAVAAKVLSEDGHQGKAYELSGAEALSFAEIADKFSSALSRPVRYTCIPQSDFKTALIAHGIPEWFANDMVNFHAAYDEGCGAVVTDTVAKLTQTPPIRFDQFITEFL
jgi:uncharacterized protein YbjT (DUF2867 family)